MVNGALSFYIFSIKGSFVTLGESALFDFKYRECGQKKNEIKKETASKILN